MIVGDSRCPENAAPSPFVNDTQRLSKLNVDEDNPSAEITSFFDNTKHELFPGKNFEYFGTHIHDGNIP